MIRNPRGGTLATPDSDPSVLDGLKTGYTTAPVNNQTDPLGIGVHQRSVAGENAGLQAIPFGADPLNIQHQAALQSLVQASADPQGFNSMNQAIKENAPGGVRGGRGTGDPLSGLSTAPGMYNAPPPQEVLNGLRQGKPKSPFQVG